MRIVLLCVGLLHLIYYSQGQAPAVFREYRKTFTTYPFSDPDPIPSQGLIYPYFRYDGFTNTPVQKEWKVVELENDFIKVMILPEIGGKIWTAIEKATGKPYIYYNQVVKFRDVAMRGPWTSGGLEPNYGIIGHTPNCATPVDYLVRMNPDKSVSCFIGVFDLLTRTRWQMEINVPHDKAFFTTRSFWNNPTSIEQPYYHWMNAGIKVKGNLEFIYPGTHYIGHAGEYADWPVNKENGKQIRFYEQNDFGSYKSYHVFGKYTDFFGAYWHDDQLGMVRYAPYEEKAGKKIWIWGLSRQGMIWEKMLTDNDGQYAEIQSGRLFNQNAEQSSFTPFKHIGFAPQATDQWTEYWYPVRHTKGMKVANAYASVNVTAEDGWLKWYCSPVQYFADSIHVYADGKKVIEKAIQAIPLQWVADSVKVPAFKHYRIHMPGIQLEWESDPDYQVLNRPLQTPASFDWNGTYGLFVQGKELMDQKQFSAAETKLNQAIASDPHYLPALTKLAELHYRNGHYQLAYDMARRALSIDIHEGAANYYYGISAWQLGRQTDALDGLSIAVLTPAYRTASYTELAKIFMQRADWQRAVEYADKATDFNRHAVTARELKAMALRKRGLEGAAWSVLNELEKEQPLSPFVRSETIFWGKSEGMSPDMFNRNELPQEVWMELAASYLACGLVKEGEVCLEMAGRNAIPLYWRAYLHFKSGRPYQALLEQANAASPLQVFPFRAECIPVFQWAMSTSDHWKPRYYLALLLKDKNQQEAGLALLNAVGDAADFAPLYAVRSIWRGDSDPLSILDLKKAISIEPAAWRTHKLLTQLLIRTGDYPGALRAAEQYVQQYPGNYIMDMLYAKTLLLNKRYRECDALLTRMDIIPFEGATEGRLLYWEAKLMQAMEQLEQKKYKQALRFVDEAALWPENLGVGKPYDTDFDSRLEQWLRYHIYQLLGNLTAADQAFQSILAFKPGIYNTVMNFQSANHYLTAKAMEVRDGREAAAAWLNEQVKLFPDLSTMVWARQLFTTGDPGSALPDDAGARVIARWVERTQR